MTKDYIEREAAKSEFNIHFGGVSHAVIASKILDEIPTADVVEVVRCGKCKHWNEDALACDLLPWVDSSEHENWYAEDFCSYGERRGA